MDSGFRDYIFYVIVSLYIYFLIERTRLKTSPISVVLFPKLDEPNPRLKFGQKNKNNVRLLEQSEAKKQRARVRKIKTIYLKALIKKAFKCWPYTFET